VVYSQVSERETLAGGLSAVAASSEMGSASGRIASQVGTIFAHKGNKVWEWRVCTQEQYLLRYAGGTMDVYTATSTTQRWWKREEMGCDAELLGVPCTVRDGSHGTVAITSAAAPPDPVDLPESFFEVLQEWGNTWMWDSLQLIGDDNWLPLHPKNSLDAP
jgi:hypothetical protein